MLARPPIAPLRPFVRLLWAGFTPLASARPAREHVLPTGHMHLLGGAPHSDVESPSPAVVGGARAGYCAKQAGTHGWSVGAQPEPGAAGAQVRGSSPASRPTRALPTRRISRASSAASPA